MSTVNIKTGQHCSDSMTKERRQPLAEWMLLVLGACFLVGFLFPIESVKAWEVDWSRRRLEFDKVSDQDRLPASAPSPVENPLGSVFDFKEVAKDIVILNTPKGFVPEMIQLRQGNSYKVHVVNVNDQKKNVSIIVDAFGQHHNTIFGTPRTFVLTPKTEGVFSFQCPETSFQGKIVVLPQERSPASSER